MEIHGKSFQDSPQGGFSPCLPPWCRAPLRQSPDARWVADAAAGWPAGLLAGAPEHGEIPWEIHPTIGETFRGFFIAG